MNRPAGCRTDLSLPNEFHRSNFLGSKRTVEDLADSDETREVLAQCIRVELAQYFERPLPLRVRIAAFARGVGEGGLDRVAIPTLQIV